MLQLIYRKTKGIFMKITFFKIWFICALLYIANSYSYPRVSIITSLYKGGEFIQGFMEDITQQTIFSDCELIIINANSPDNEEVIITSYLQKYENIKYIRLEEDPGLYAVWNLAIKISQAPYITNANVDDRLRFDCYELHANALDAHKEVDLVYSDAYITENPNETFDTRSSQKRLDIPSFSLKKLKGQCLPNNHPMWRRSVHENFGFFDETLKIAADWDFWLHIATKGSLFLKIDQPLGLYYNNPKGLSTDSSGAGMKEFHIVYNRYNQNEKPDPHFAIVVASRNNTFEFENKKVYQRNLDSIFMQTYPHFRVIYIDDCSTDGTADAVASYVAEKKESNRFHLIRNPQRYGPSRNRYIGAHVCDDDEIVCILDGDDTFAHPHVLEKLAAIYKHNDVWVTYSQFLTIPDKTISGGKATPDWVIKNNVYRKFGWHYHSLKTFYAWLFKQIELKDLLYDGAFFTAASDLAEMFPLIEMSGGKFLYIPDILYHALQHPHNEMHTEGRQFMANMGAIIMNLMKPYKSLTQRPEKKEIGSIAKLFLPLYIQKESKKKSVFLKKQLLKKLHQMDQKYIFLSTVLTRPADNKLNEAVIALLKVGAFATHFSSHTSLEKLIDLNGIISTEIETKAFDYRKIDPSISSSFFNTSCYKKEDLIYAVEQLSETAIDPEELFSILYKMALESNTVGILVNG